ncbi:2-C-methyl-D-erythritol 2,4-cyclodiphosphate synthase [bacterium]|nr:2-C-methyl-D-erythritol 2,4-cyclodiphosphate synthase [bacterium]
MSLKSGLGYDIHRLKEGKKLYLGGIQILSSKGLVGHSDGDCLIHAIIDALLGAAGEGDIGQWFPPTDPRYKDVRSSQLLKEVMRRIEERGIEILHVDTIIITEKPKLFSYIPRMKETLASLLQIRPEDLGIKAKTNEGLGAVGREEAVAAWATALVRQK